MFALTSSFRRAPVWANAISMKRSRSRRRSAAGDSGTRRATVSTAKAIASGVR